MKKMIAIAFSIFLSAVCAPLCAQTVESLDKVKAVDTLNDLVQINIDAYYAYGEALEGLKNAEVKDQFVKLREEHNQRINALADKVRELAGTPPKFSTDMKGTAMKYYTKLRGVTGDVGIVKAMHTNEAVALDHYKAALKLNFGSDIKDLLESQLTEQQDQVVYMDKTSKIVK